MKLFLLSLLREACRFENPIRMKMSDHLIIVAKDKESACQILIRSKSERYSYMARLFKEALQANSENLEIKEYNIQEGLTILANTSGSVLLGDIS